MPNLRCPSCYYSTTIRKEAIEGVCCGTCGFDLFDFYYSGKSASEAASFIAEKGVELKKKKAKAERERRNQNSTAEPYQSVSRHTKPRKNVMSSKESLTEKVLGYGLAVAFILVFYGGFQYFQLRSGIQETTIELLTDNGHSGYKADGITLPLSAAFGGITTAKVFLEDNAGNTQAIEVEITQKGIPVLTILAGSEYYIEISGLELMQLK